MEELFIRDADCFLVCHSYNRRELTGTARLLDLIRRYKQYDADAQLPVLLVVQALSLATRESIPLMLMLSNITCFRQPSVILLPPKSK